MRQKLITAIKLFAGSAAIAAFLLAAWGFRIIATTSGIPPEAFCHDNLKEMGLAFKQYSQDCGDRFPLAVTGGKYYGWADVIRPYEKDAGVFQCPSEPNPAVSNPRMAGYTDYWFNHNLSAKKDSELDLEAMTILSGDGNDGSDPTNARYSYSRLPITWLSDVRSPAHRHRNGLELLFADGHAKLLTPQKIVASSSNGPSFSLN